VSAPISWRSAERSGSFPPRQFQDFRPYFDDGLALPDLTQWVAFYGGYHLIPPEAGAEWDRRFERYREM
jgi:hypothetical protein